MNMEKKRIIVFGLGKMFREFLDDYNRDNIQIVGLTDNNSNMWGQEIAGLTVINPTEIEKTEYDYIVITCNAHDEIREVLLQMEIDENRIIEYSIDKCGSDDSFSFLLNQTFYLKNKVNTLQKSVADLIKIQENNSILTAKQLIQNNNNKRMNALWDAEFKVFSQFGEDGIIQWLIHNIDIRNKVFVEFGVEDYSESNTRFLLMNDNWSGLVIDGSEKNVTKIKNSYYFWRQDLQAVSQFITKDNINQIITEAGIQGDIGILSVDIDGNDYWVLDAIDCVNPQILICEYNSVFGAEQKVSVPYDASFVRKSAHHSCLYWGASLGAFCYWAKEHGYSFVGSNSAGNNAFFVRNDCVEPIKYLTEEACYVESKFRESRDVEGKLTLISGANRLMEIASMPLIDVENGSEELIANKYKLSEKR